MRWKTVVLAGCLAPALAGCNIYYYAARNIINEPITLAEQLCRTHNLRSEARDAWYEVREQYSRCLFTAEFQDGFVEGFSDYLDRGGYAQPPAVPPKKYTRNKYLTAACQPLVQDYFLGFQYGVEVALATGQRKTLVVPVLLPTRTQASPTFNVVRPPAAAAAGEPLPPPQPAVPVPTAVPVPADVRAPAAGPRLTAGPRLPFPAAAAATAPTNAMKFNRPEAEPEEARVDVADADRLPPTPVPTGGPAPDAARRACPRRPRACRPCPTACRPRRCSTNCRWSRRTTRSPSPSRCPRRGVEARTAGLRLSYLPPF